MTIKEILLETAKSIRLSGATMRMFPTVEIPPVDDRPGWMVDRDNLANDAQAALQCVISELPEQRDDKNGQ